MTILAYHWLSAPNTYANGLPWSLEVEHTGKLELCASGLHASVRAIDSLQYAPGPILCRVECSGEIIHGDDKLVCSRRKVLWQADATQVLRVFARRCASDVLHLWSAPEIVKEYLATGDESKRDAAWDAAYAAVDAAWDAARRDAARAAAYAAGDAAYAAWDAARAAAYAAYAARAAARDAAWDAVWDAARDRYNIWLAEMLETLAPKSAEGRA